MLGIRGKLSFKKILRNYKVFLSLRTDLERNVCTGGDPVTRKAGVGSSLERRASRGKDGG